MASVGVPVHVDQQVVAWSALTVGLPVGGQTMCHAPPQVTGGAAMLRALVPIMRPVVGIATRHLVRLQPGGVASFEVMPRALPSQRVDK